MSLISPSINMVTLSGVLHEAPRRSISADGGAMVDMIVVTGVDGRAVKHSVRVLDKALSESAMAGLRAGMVVTAIGELDYDATGCFVAILDRRACDLRYSTAPAIQAAPVASPAVVADKPAVVEPPKTVRPVEPAAPSSASEPQPEQPDGVPESPEPAAAQAPTDPKPAAPAPMKRMGLGMPPSTAPKPAQPAAPKPAGGIGGLGGLRSSAPANDAPEEGSPEPAQQSRPSLQPPVRTASFARPAAVIGADASDDDIPF